MITIIMNKNTIATFIKITRMVILILVNVVVGLFSPKRKRLG